jgi:DNA transposition AAA+ family ATPase
VPGVGKTHAIRRLASEDHNFHTVTAGPTNRTPKTFLSDVAHALGMYSGSRSAHDSFEMIKTHLYGYQDKIVAIDEAQNLDLETMRIMLEIYEETGVPIAFVGNFGVLRRTKVNRTDFDQIDDRIAFRLEIKNVHADDIRAFGIHYDIEFKAHADLIKFGANKSIRKLCHLLDEARILAGPKCPIRLEHLREAVTFLHGDDDDRGIFKLISRSKREENAA